MAYQYIYGSDTMEAATRKINENFLDIPTSESITAEAVAEAKEYTNSVVSNPNLLINGDFQVWQRGTSFSQTSFTERYTADRWRAVSTDGTVQLTVQKSDRGMELFADQSGSSAQIRYRMAEEDLAKIRGKTCTLSYSIDDVVTTRQVTVSETAQETDILFSISISVSTTHKYLNWVKLEIGTVATQFVPRPYAEELAMCQRYFLPITNPDSSNGTLGIGAYNSNGYIVLNMPIITSMRTKPTLSGAYTGNRLRLYYTPTAYEQVSNAEVLDYSAAFVTLALTPGGSNIPTNENRAINVVYASNGHFYLDAEIYP